MISMQEIWLTIERILTNKFPSILRDFNPPCTINDLDFLKTITNNQLADLYEFYALHDGQSSYDLAFSSPWRLLSVRHIKSNLKVMNEDLTAQWEEDGISPSDEAEAQGPVKPVLWNRKWIPIASNGGGDLLCIDLDPDTGGRLGQIIIWWHETVLREVLYSSFSGMMSDYLHDLQVDMFEFISGIGLSKI
jgi:cell wall assembly regulator SMI1